jgi:flagellar biosynthesis protein FliR
VTDQPFTLLVTYFSLALARVGGFATACPVVFPETVPALVRAGVVAVLALSFTASQPELVTPDSPTLCMFSELGLGIAMGLVVRAACATMQFAGDLIDGQVGFGFAKHFNPSMADEVGPIQHLLYILMVLGFSLCGGFEATIRGLAASFRAFPIGQILNVALWTSHLTERVGSLVEVGLRVALPIVLAVTATQVALALMTRIAPTLNIWSIGFAVTLSVGFGAIWISTPYLLEEVRLIWREQTDGVLVWED